MQHQPSSTYARVLCFQHNMTVSFSLRSWVLLQETIPAHPNSPRGFLRGLYRVIEIQPVSSCPSRAPHSQPAPLPCRRPDTVVQIYCQAANRKAELYTEPIPSAGLVFVHSPKEAGISLVVADSMPSSRLVTMKTPWTVTKGASDFQGFINGCASLFSKGISKPTDLHIVTAFLGMIDVDLAVDHEVQSPMAHKLV